MSEYLLEKGVVKATPFFISISHTTQINPVSQAVLVQGKMYKTLTHSSMVKPGAKKDL